MSSTRERSHQRMYQTLQAFIATHQRLPKRYDPDSDPALFLWMGRQRAKYEAGTLDSHLVKQLRALPLNVLGEGAGSKRYRTLDRISEFHQEHGRWPGHSENPKERELYELIRAWRARLNFGANSASLRHDLENAYTHLAPAFDPNVALYTVRDAHFQIHLERVKKFRDTHGRLPKISEDRNERTLARWLRGAIKAHDAGNLTQARSQHLNAFISSVRAAVPHPDR